MDETKPFSPVQFGRYQLVARLATGGMAEIFRAKAVGAMGFEKALIIKRIRPELAGDAELVRMFGTEARLVCNLQHPNIVQVYELDQVDGVLYIAMEHVEGIDAHVLWRTLARRGQRLPAQLALYIVAEALEGLAFAHGAVGPDGRPLGVVHRDVSPSNILLSSLGDVKIGDFGIALVTHESRSRSGVLKGKYGYMTPEQIAGLPLDHRCDLFAAGVVLAELLTGRRLFAAPTDFETMRRVLNVRLEVLDRHEGVLAPALLRLVRRALRRDPAERYPSAGAFRDAVVGCLADLHGRVDGRTLAAFIAQHVAPHVEQAPPPAEPTPTPATAAAHPPRPRQIAVPAPSPAQTEIELEEETASLEQDETLRREPQARWLAADTLLDLPPAAPLAPPPAPAGAAPPPRTGAALEAEPTYPWLRADGSALLEFPSPLGSDEPAAAPRAPDVPRPRSDSLLIVSAAPRREDSLLIELPPPREPAPAGAHGPRGPRELEFEGSGEFAELELDGGARGGLSALPLARLLFRYLVAARSGLLVLTGPRTTERLAAQLARVEALARELGAGAPDRREAQTTCQIHLQDGHPALLAADRSEALVAAHLLQMRVISPQELDAATRPFPSFQPVTALLARERITPLELGRLINSFVQWSLLDAFSWREGTYTFYPGRGQPPDAFLTGLNMMQLIARGIAAMEEGALDHHLRRLEQRRIALNPCPTVEIKQLRNDPLLAAICRRLGAARPLDEALREAQELDTPRRIKQAFFFLIACELAELH